MTGQELKPKLASAVELLDLLSGFTQNVVDDRFVQYLQAVVDSDALLDLLADDLAKIGLSVTSDNQLRLVSVASDGSEVEQALGDGTLLRLLIELMPLIIQILNNFPFAKPQPPTTPYPVP